MKYLTLAAQSRKEIITQKLLNEKNDTYNYQDKYIATPEFNDLEPWVFTERLAKANLITGTEIDTELKNIQQKINSKKLKNLIQEILDVKVILKKIEHKIGQYFS